MHSGQHLHLLPQKALYWAEERTLVIADLHVGKAAHFRRHGVPVSGLVQQEDLRRLAALIHSLDPERLLFLGDLSHSAHNAEWEAFAAFIRPYDFPKLLIRGNHDILAASAYADAQIAVHASEFASSPFVFTHEPPSEAHPEGLYALSGHIHPGVLMGGAGRQKLRLPCFHFGAKGAVLPAFGGFTGLAPITIEARDQVFVVGKGEVVKMDVGG